MECHRFGEPYIPVAIGWKKRRDVAYLVGSHLEFGRWDPHAGEGDSFTLLSLQDKRVVLKPPRSALKRFLTLGNLTAHAKTHKISFPWERQGLKRGEKKASYGCCHLSEREKKSALIPFFSPLLWGHCEPLIKTST